MSPVLLVDRGTVRQDVRRHHARTSYAILTATLETLRICDRDKLIGPLARCAILGKQSHHDQTERTKALQRQL
jgi:hypothetical protein